MIKQSNLKLATSLKKLVDLQQANSFAQRKQASKTPTNGANSITLSITQQVTKVKQPAPACAEYDLKENKMKRQFTENILALPKQIK